MPKTMDFEAKYQAADAEPFSQCNEMWKRPRREPELRELGKALYDPSVPEDRPGFERQDIAFRNASWYLDSRFARSIYETGFGLYTWENKRDGLCTLPEDAKFDGSDAAYNTRMVKKAAKLYGANLVGICKYDKRWTYTKGFDLYRREDFEIEIPDECEYVINIAVAMDYDHYKYTPTFIGGAGTGYGYSKMAFSAGLTAQFLRQLGYKAIPMGNDTALSIPYAIQAGLGELGRNGMLITPKYGPCVRLCKVLTDLPLVCDKPIEFGVAEFCDVCKKCATSCPGAAIPEGERSTEPVNISNAGGALKWMVDGERCFKFAAVNKVDCGNCVRACPFTKPQGWLHDWSRWIIQRFPLLNRLFVKIDDWLGYGEQGDLAAFWRED
jgi:epoxyqueuosine reductase